MNKKVIAEIVIIVLAFAGAGWVLYSGLFSPSGGTSLVATSSPASGLSANPLPYGNHLDFGAVNASRFTFNQIQYPVLDPANDVGIPEANLVSSQIPVSTPSGTTTPSH